MDENPSIGRGAGIVATALGCACYGMNFWLRTAAVHRHLISVTGLMSLAACAAGPNPAQGPAADTATAVPAEIGMDLATPAKLTSMVWGEEDGNDALQTPIVIDGGNDLGPVVTTLALGEEEDGGGTQVSTMALGEEDAPWPPITSLWHGEEEGGGGTMISDEPIDLSEDQGIEGQPDGLVQVSPDQLASVAEIMTTLRLSRA